MLTAMFHTDHKANSLTKTTATHSGSFLLLLYVCVHTAIHIPKLYKPYTVPKTNPYSIHILSGCLLLDITKNKSKTTTKFTLHWFLIYDF